MIKDNLLRRQLSDWERGKAGEELQKIYTPEAEERQLSTLRMGNKAPDSPKMDTRESGRAAELAGKNVGVGSQYVYDAKKIKNEAPERRGLIKKLPIVYSG